MKHSIGKRLEALLAGQKLILERLDKMATTLDDLLAKVTTQGTTIGSVLTLLKALQDQIAGAGLTPAQQAKVDAIFAAVTADEDKLNAALTANVPTP